MTWKLKELEDSLLIGSTLVEGSTLSEAEARQIFAGKTVQGHPILEARELINYRAAVQWLMGQFTESPYLSRELVLGFHLMLFQGFAGTHGRWKTHANYTFLTDGSRHDYSKPANVEAEMRGWIARFNMPPLPRSHPAQLAAELYYGFEHIHPFDDGNGRIGRVLVAYWLHYQADLGWTFKLKDKIEHLKALESANRSDLVPLSRFFEKRARKEKGDK